LHYFHASLPVSCFVTDSYASVFSSEFFRARPGLDLPLLDIAKDFSFPT
jgi:hypothetical protein